MFCRHKDNRRLAASFVEENLRALLTDVLFKVHIHDPEILMAFLEILPALRQIEKETNGPEFLVNVLRYILSSGDSQEFEDPRPT